MQTKPIAMISVILFSTLTLTGCKSWYDITPDTYTIKIPQAQQPISHPITLISITGTDLTELQSGLSESHLFTSVNCPLSAVDYDDLTLNVKLTYEQGVDNMITDNLLSQIIMAEIIVFSAGILDQLFDGGSKYTYECSADLCRNRKILKTYSARGQSIIRHDVWNPRRNYSSEAAGAAMRVLQSDLAQQLIEDRSFIEKSLNSTNAESDI